MSGVTTTRLDAIAGLIRDQLGLDVTLGPLLEADAQSSALMVGLTPYSLTRDALNGQDLEAVQIRIRARKNVGNRALWDAQDQIWNLLTTTRISDNVAVAWRNMSTPAQPDSAGRNQVFDSYYLRTDRLGQTG